MRNRRWRRAFYYWSFFFSLCFRFLSFRCCCALLLLLLLSCIVGTQRSEPERIQKISRSFIYIKEGWCILQEQQGRDVFLTSKRKFSLTLLFGFVIEKSKNQTTFGSIRRERAQLGCIAVLFHFWIRSARSSSSSFFYIPPIEKLVSCYSLSCIDRMPMTMMSHTNCVSPLLLLLFHIISTLKSSTESCCIFIFFMLSSSKYFQELDDFVASLFSTFNSVTIFWLNMFIRIEFLFRSRMGEVRFLSSSSGFYSIQFHPAGTTHISVFYFFFVRW